MLFRQKNLGGSVRKRKRNIDSVRDREERGGQRVRRKEKEKKGERPRFASSEEMQEETKVSKVSLPQ